jgi:hypothetical protein
MCLSNYSTTTNNYFFYTYLLVIFQNNHNAIHGVYFQVRVSNLELSEKVLASNVVPFTDSPLNEGGHYSRISHEFVCPHDGVYILSLSFKYSKVVSGQKRYSTRALNVNNGSINILIVTNAHNVAACVDSFHEVGHAHTISHCAKGGKFKVITNADLDNMDTFEIFFTGGLLYETSATEHVQVGSFHVNTSHLYHSNIT